MARVGVEHQIERIGASVVGCNFPPEEACVQALAQQRWSEGFRYIRDVYMITPSQRLPDVHLG